MAYEDLLKDSSFPLDNKNYFNLVITDLNSNTGYPIQFRWKYEDGSYGPWSVSRTIAVPAESSPNTPSQLSVANNTAGHLQITWDGNTSTGSPLTNFDRVDIYINGLPFDSSKPAASFFKAGTQTIVAPAGVYIISSYAVSKSGTQSALSSPVTRTVTALGVPVQTPTLPSGITVATAPFAVSVNWPGTYSVATFTGFKSIDIYAVGSDLGSTATSGITSTNLVGSLTVNDTPNKINIGLDNLKQALGLSTTSDVYTSTIFYYYNATNTNGDKYGSPTYTRINSSSVVPTKANYIDLASGVISIENLVAGNGSFSSWLRTGSAGGARIELSAVSDFTNGGNTVQKGLVAYTSGNTELFNLDLDNSTLTINGSGTFSGSLSAATGSFTGSLSIGTQSGGQYPFSVSSSGVLRAVAGTIGGWTLADGYFSGTNFQISGSDSTIYVGNTGSTHLRINSSGIASYTGGSANNVLNISTTGNITATSGTFSGSITGATGTFSGTISSASNISAGGTLTGSDIDIQNDSATNRVKTSYPRSTPVSGSVVSSLGINAIAMISQSTAGVVSHWYPYLDAESDIGTPTYKWRFIRSNNGTIQTSDERKKTDILNSDLGLNFINLLRPVKFKNKYTPQIPQIDESGQVILDENGNRVIEENQEYIGIRNHYGFIAQEVKQALDTLGVGDNFSGWALDDINDLNSYQSLSYDKFIAPLTKAVQELSARLDALEG